MLQSKTMFSIRIVGMLYEKKYITEFVVNGFLEYLNLKDKWEIRILKGQLIRTCGQNQGLRVKLLGF